MKPKERSQIMAPKIDINGNITRIELNQVNCYLIKASNQFILIDTGYAKQRKELEGILKKAGCERGNLRLIILTHGDFDHTGNCAYFREKFNCRVAMHYDDLGMVQFGDLFWNRNLNWFTRLVGKIMLFFMRMKLRKEDRFTPAVFLEDGQDLSKFGLEAKVIHIPGHSMGSIGVLTNNGEFFCGDLLSNTRGTPEKTELIADAAEYEQSIHKVTQLNIGTVYPGHGTPFSMNAFVNVSQEEE